MTHSHTTFFDKLRQFSNWIDQKFFPLPATKEQRRRTEQEAIEAGAKMISAEIDKCVKIYQTYDAYDAINDFKMIWGESTMVTVHYNSLMLKLRIKQNEIMKDL